MDKKERKKEYMQIYPNLQRLHLNSLYAKPLVDFSKIYIIEFFSYACPHCYKFEPYLASWKKDLPEDVVFFRVPLLLSSTKFSKDLGRIYSTLLLLKKDNELHNDVFDLLHSKQLDMSQFWNNLKKLLESESIDFTEFQSKMASKEVLSLEDEAKEIIQAFEVQSVPTFFIKNKRGDIYKILREVGEANNIADLLNKAIAHHSQTP